MMIIEEHNPSHTVDEYDIILAGGILQTFTLDTDKGDSIEFLGSPLLAVKIQLVAKASIITPDVYSPAEDITIYASHILCITHRTREVTSPSPSQKAEFRTLQPHPTVQ